MKKFLSLLAVVMTLGLTTVAFDAEAKRLGGSRSLGMQRQATPPAKAPTAAPNAAPAAAGAAAAGRSKWMGPLAGIAAGLGLAALASYLGFGEEFATMLLIGLAVMVALAVFGMIMRKRAAQQGGMAHAGAAAGAGSARPLPAAFRSGSQDQFPAASGAAGGSMIGARLQGGTPAIPADFDVGNFVRNAKINYIRLQAANDAGNLDDLREFTTPEMFAELQMDIRERGAAAQKTEVLDLDGDVLEVVEEGHRYIVSVRFTGSVREDGEVNAVNEIWHMTKPRQGAGGWVLAGIQQAG
ncbi:MAG: Tim44 domain-containing protein [Gammaproteobacteria bacterium]